MDLTRRNPGTGPGTFGPEPRRVQVDVTPLGSAHKQTVALRAVRSSDQSSISCQPAQQYRKNFRLP